MASLSAHPRTIYRAFGAARLCWGSDYPTARRAMTYRQALEIVRSRCTFVASHALLELIMGGTLAGLLGQGESSG